MDYIIKEEIENLYEINKSKFIAILTPIDDIKEIDNILNSIKKRYPKATHYCYGLALKKETLINKSNDDGEPSGTAGVVILKAINNKNITNALLTVVRYFGGIKLGAGGLIRAYNTASCLVLDKANLFIEKEYHTYHLELDYNLDNKFEQLIRSLNGFIIDKDYQEKIKCTFALEKDETSQINEFFLGKVQIIKLENIKKIVKANP
ncbi:MAG: DUF1949 domain-containing protein [Erysipelotrichaceae bacterium]|nr:DUF1949 domain-containing protein [Erysipelotrichaceae bacterium]